MSEPDQTRLSADAVQRIRDLVEMLRDQGIGGLGKPDIVRLARDMDVPGGVTVDLTAEERLGAPLVVLRLPAAAGTVPAVFHNLSPREREVAVLVAAGLSNKLIARQLSVTLGTVKDHVHHILQKTELPNRAAIAAAFSNQV